MKKGEEKVSGLFQNFMNDMKAKFAPVKAKLKQFTDPGYLKNKILLPLLRFLDKIFNLRPKDENDYYGVFGWMISKRLAFVCVVVLGLISVFYVAGSQPLSPLNKEKGGIKTYSYDSIPLKFTKGKVRILAKSDYVAYEGEVERGAANGSGILYRKDGTKVYEGQFENSKFQGTGTSYYANGQIQYTGSFQQNLYSGEGSLYRQNGALEYEGAFLGGMKEGRGVLYDSGNNEIYRGNFQRNEVLYSDFIDKSTKEVGELYKGKKSVYLDEEYFVVEMTDLNAVYFGSQQVNNLTDEISVEGIYVLKDTFAYAGEDKKTIFELNHYLGDATYEGNSYINMPEAVAIHIRNQSGNEFYGEVITQMDQYLTDAAIVNEFDADFSVYIYTYVCDEIRYTFYCKDRSGKFFMYLIEKEK